MSIDLDSAEKAANDLYDALRSQSAIPPLTDFSPLLTIEDAYRIQGLMLARRLRETGEHIVGKKIGITSQAVMDMLNVRQPDFGQLTSGMRYEDGATIQRRLLIAPKAEGEIAFLLRHDLRGPGITPDDVLNATECVMPCFEIVDSRVRDWKIKIQDTVADNASSGAFVIGVGQVDPREIDLASVGMTFFRNGQVVNRGFGSAALGHPLHAVAWLANQLGKLGMTLFAGEVVLSGALSAMVPVQAGDHMRIEIEGIGSASVSFV